MKATLTILVCSLSLATSTFAEPPAKGQGKGKGGMPEFLKKYDTNKDGKLDEGERAGISAEDKAKVKEAMKGKGKGGKGGKGAPEGGKGGKGDAK